MAILVAMTFMSRRPRKTLSAAEAADARRAERIRAYQAAVASGNAQQAVSCMTTILTGKARIRAILKSIEIPDCDCPLQPSCVTRWAPKGCDTRRAKGDCDCVSKLSDCCPHMRAIPREAVLRELAGYLPQLRAYLDAEHADHERNLVAVWALLLRAVESDQPANCYSEPPLPAVASDVLERGEIIERMRARHDAGEGLYHPADLHARGSADAAVQMEKGRREAGFRFERHE